jgi:DNA-binding MarR family transcriptional regulator
MVEAATLDTAIIDISYARHIMLARDRTMRSIERGQVMEQERLEEQLWPPGGTTPADTFLFEQGALLRAAKGAFQRRVGITDSRLHMLGMLYRFGEMSQNELQRRLDVDGAAVTRQVKQLEAERLLSRRADPADNRFTLVTLTDEGKASLRDVARTAREFIAETLDGVSDEDLECVRRTMARMRANIEKMGSPRADSL